MLNGGESRLKYCIRSECFPCGWSKRLILYQIYTLLEQAEYWAELAERRFARFQQQPALAQQLALMDAEFFKEERHQVMLR